MKKRTTTFLLALVFLSSLLGLSGCSQAPEDQVPTGDISEIPPNAGTETGNPPSPSPSSQPPTPDPDTVGPGGSSGTGGSSGSSGTGGMSGNGGTSGSAGGISGSGGSSGTAGSAGGGAGSSGTSGSAGGRGGISGTSGSSGTGGSAGSSGSAGGGGGTSGHGGHSGSGGSCNISNSNYPLTLPTTSGVDFTLFPPSPNLNFLTNGNTFYVSTTGRDPVDPGIPPDPNYCDAYPRQSDYRTINKAIFCARAGDKIVIRAGTYAEGDVNTGYGLPIYKNNMIVTNAPCESVIITPRNSTYSYGVRLGANNIIFNGITVRNFSAVNIELGGLGRTVSNIVLSNLTVQAQVEGIINYEDLGAPYTTPTVNGLLLENVTITNALGLGFSCNAGPCQNVRMNNVYVQNRSTPNGNSGSDCIAFERGDNLVFNNVETTGCEADGLDLKATRVLVYNSYFHNPLRNGLKLWKGGDVQNTIVSNTGADGAVIFDGPGAYRMINSIVAHHLNGRAGAYTMTVDYDTTCGRNGNAANYCCNTVYANTCGPLTLEITNSVFWNDSGPLFVPTGTGLTLRNNLFAGFSDDSDGDGSGDFLEIRDRNSLRIDTPNQYGSGNLTYPNNAIPSLFMNAAANITNKDWRAVSGSPLINAGIVPNLPTFPSFDFFGNARIQGGSPDLGPIENR